LLIRSGCRIKKDQPSDTHHDWCYWIEPQEQQIQEGLDEQPRNRLCL